MLQIPSRANLDESSFDAERGIVIVRTRNRNEAGQQSVE
jgi:hypothetical protein